MQNKRGTIAIIAKQRYPGCKILLFSGQAATANRLGKARESGYDFEILLKPVNPKDLLPSLEVSKQAPRRKPYRLLPGI